MTRRRPARSKRPARKKKIISIAWQRQSIRQIVAIISKTLREQEFDVILTGAACAAVYCPSIRPKTVELVVSEYRVTPVNRVMRRFGFRPRELRVFRNPAAPFDIIFSPAPPIVGDEAVEKTTTLKSAHGYVTLLSPTDCVRQCLGVWYRIGDREAFEHALAVARRHKVDMEIIKRWSEWEWADDQYAEFVQALESRVHDD